MSPWPGRPDERTPCYDDGDVDDGADIVVIIKRMSGDDVFRYNPLIISSLSHPLMKGPPPGWTIYAERTIKSGAKFAAIAKDFNLTAVYPS